MTYKAVFRGLLFCGLTASVFAITLSALLLFNAPDERQETTTAPVVTPMQTPPPTPPPDCKTDWHLCKDNVAMIEQLTGNSHAVEARVACEMTAEDGAKYGTPEWPWLVFSSTYDGNDATKTGILTLIEPSAHFKNAFNASVKSEVICVYNMNIKQVTSLSVQVVD